MNKLSFLLLSILVFSCEKNETLALAENTSNTEPITETKEAFVQSEDFKNYWYAGEAEITSYRLQQARYGELREGNAVLIYVTEDFRPKKQVKADFRSKDDVSVLKLNATKNFTTGIYPYSIMQSTFYPVANNAHAIKVTSSMQEWCGHVFAQINNRDQFDVQAYSYFESEGDQKFELDKTVLENELWTQLRIDPESLPQGEIKVIPSLEFTRLKHVDIKAYNAEATLEGDLYTLSYPELNRSLTIQFNPKFPYDIVSWEESFKSGFGTNARTLTTKATKIKTIKSAYWSKNSNADEVLRETLKLD